MAENGNAFIGLPLETLQELQTLYVQVLKDIAVAGQSYSFPGRSFTRADIPNVKSVLADVGEAIAIVAPELGVGGRQIAYATINTQAPFAR
jgi:hypothetical protein